MVFKAAVGHVFAVDLMNARIAIIVIVEPRAAGGAVSACVEKLGKARVGHRQAVDLERGQMHLMRRAFIFGAVVVAHGEGAGGDGDHLLRQRAATR